MSQGQAADVTIGIVNYRTLDLTRLCLRSIRKHTCGAYRVLVIDNHSDDASLDYLRRLSWITLIERKPEVPDPDGSYAHGAGLDLALEHCQSPLFVSLHSDTVILQPGWLARLTTPFSDPQVGSVGCGKLELKPSWQQWLQRVTDLKALKRALMADAEEKLRYRYFNTSICSAYRVQTLREEDLSFRGKRAQRLTVGREIHFGLEAGGYRTVALPSRQMQNSIAHLAHATQALHAREFNMLGCGERKYLNRARKVLDRPEVQAILQDCSLDE